MSYIMEGRSAKRGRVFRNDSERRKIMRMRVRYYRYLRFGESSTQINYFNQPADFDQPAHPRNVTFDALSDHQFLDMSLHPCGLLNKDPLELNEEIETNEIKIEVVDDRIKEEKDECDDYGKLYVEGNYSSNFEEIVLEPRIVLNEEVLPIVSESESTKKNQMMVGTEYNSNIYDFKKEPISSVNVNRSPVAIKYLRTKEVQGINHELNDGSNICYRKNKISCSPNVVILKEDYVDNNKEGMIRREEYLNEECQADGIKVTPSKPIFSCNVCEKSFYHKNNLTKHQKIHTGIKPYKCSMCERSFIRSADLKSHERTHTGSKPFKCNTCQKSFAEKRSLKRHEKIHAGIKSYKCNICGKFFTTSSSLKIHIRRHTGNKPYKCNVCEKSFSCSSDLKTHQRKHTGVKPYKCDVCDKLFSCSSNLRIHEILHKSVTPYTCDVCKVSYAFLKDIKQHVLTHINNKVPS